ncbi:MAG TPA: hypothetical protein V6C82_08855 [Chroococcales cyanobacterium]
MEEVVCAKAFHLLDSQGKVCAAWMVDEKDQPGFALYGKSPTPRALLFLGENDNPVLTFMDKNGRGMLTLSLAEDLPLLTLSDSRGTPRISLSLPLETPTLELQDERGCARARLRLGNRQSPAFDLCDEAGKSRLGFLLGEKDQKGRLLFFDEEEEVRGVIGLDNQQTPHFEGFSEEDLMVWRLGE